MAAFTPRAVVAYLDAEFPTTEWEPGIFYLERGLYHQQIATLNEMLAGLDMGDYHLPADDESRFVMAQMAIRAFLNGPTAKLDTTTSLGKNPVAVVREVLLAASNARGGAAKAVATVARETPLADDADSLRSPNDDSESPDLAILIALDEEFDQFRALVDKLRPIPDEEYGGYVYMVDIPGPPGARNYRCVVRLIGEMGPDDARGAAENLLNRWTPKSAVMLGIAASLDHEVKLGDVAVATQVDAYASNLKAVRGKRGGFNFKHRGTVYHGDHAFVEEIKGLKYAHTTEYDGWRSRGAEDLRVLIPEKNLLSLLKKEFIATDPSVARVHIASGPAVGAATAFRDWLHERDETIKALEMESAALAAAGAKRARPVRVLVIRGISDFGDERKKQVDKVGKGGVRKYAARNAARLFLTLARIGLFPRNSSSDDSAAANAPTNNADVAIRRVRARTVRDLLATAQTIAGNGNVPQACVIVAGLYEGLRIHYTRSYRKARGSGAPRNEAFLPATESICATALFRGAVQFCQEPKLANDKYGEAALASLGFSIHQLAAFRKLIEFGESALRERPTSEGSIDLRELSECSVALANKVAAIEEREPTLIAEVARALDAAMAADA